MTIPLRLLLVVGVAPRRELVDWHGGCCCGGVAPSLRLLVVARVHLLRLHVAVVLLLLRHGGTRWRRLVVVRLLLRRPHRARASILLLLLEPRPSLIVILPSAAAMAVAMSCAWRWRRRRLTVVLRWRRRRERGRRLLLRVIVWLSVVLLLLGYDSISELLWMLLDSSGRHAPIHFIVHGLASVEDNVL